MKKSSRESSVVERMKEIDATVLRLRQLFENYKQDYSHVAVSFQVSNPTLKDNGYIRFRVKLLRGDKQDSGFYGFAMVDSGYVLWVKFRYHDRSCADICRTPLPSDNETEINYIPANAAAQYMAISRGPSAVDTEIEC